MADPPGKTTAVQSTTEAVGAVSRGARVALVLYHRDGAKVVPLTPGQPVVVGREWPADAVVPDASLSRRHASFLWTDDGVTVEDLGSTNGTRLNGVPITRATFQPGDEVLAGSVAISLDAPAGKGEPAPGVEGHDRWLARLEDEVVRARTFGRSVAVLLVRATDAEPVRRWIAGARRALRPVDAVAFYGPDSALVLLPETDRDGAARAARALVEARAGRATAGVASFPETARSAEELVEVARESLRRASARTAVHAAPPRETLPPVPAEGPVVASPRMRALFETVARVARSNVPVLVLGETGTGKEVVAAAIHQASPRAAKPLRSINCGAIPGTLLESLLFGHEKGAFTGADRMQKGVFEQADGGTVFLDEVGELSAAAQVALLRVLEAKRITRVGSTEEIEVDVRIVAATHRDLEAMCEAGSFRQDLLYRLNTVPLEVPPLRERSEDVAPLARRFLAEAAAANGSTVRTIRPEAIDLLERHGWPGNVRELRNAIERAVVLATGDEIGPLDLPERVRAAAAPVVAAAAPAPAGPGDGAVSADPDADFRSRVRTYEVDLILDALHRAGGNQTEAARLLRMPVRTLAHKIQQYGLKKRFDAE